MTPVSPKLTTRKFGEPVSPPPGRLTGMLRSRTSSYDEDGIRRCRTEVIARDLRFTGRRPMAPPPPGLEDG
ncbi:hypothetical protein WME89_12130 [Sorangium sp. So ce321]|uniref:hypothetical protein n=1 Tax=Sorangium sp. So ce321 TaxID=3133300 RepID=UPI003F5D5CC8